MCLRINIDRHGQVGEGLGCFSSFFFLGQWPRKWQKYFRLLEESETSYLCYVPMVQRVESFEKKLLMLGELGSFPGPSFMRHVCYLTFWNLRCPVKWE